MDLTCSGEEGPVDFRQAVSVGNGSGVCVWGGLGVAMCLPRFSLRNVSCVRVQLWWGLLAPGHSHDGELPLWAPSSHLILTLWGGEGRPGEGGEKEGGNTSSRAQTQASALSQGVEMGSDSRKTPLFYCLTVWRSAAGLKQKWDRRREQMSNTTRAVYSHVWGVLLKMMHSFKWQCLSVSVTGMESQSLDLLFKKLILVKEKKTLWHV